MKARRFCLAPEYFSLVELALRVLGDGQGKQEKGKPTAPKIHCQGAGDDRKESHYEPGNSSLGEIELVLKAWDRVITRHLEPEKLYPSPTEYQLVNVALEDR